MDNKVGDKPSTITEWLEDKVNNLMGNNPIDWKYRHFTEQLKRDNPMIMLKANGEMWIELRGKDLYEDIKAGIRLTEQAYTGLFAEPFNIARAVHLVDPSKGLDYQLQIQLMHQSKLEARPTTPGNLFTIPSVEQVVKKYGLGNSVLIDSPIGSSLKHTAQQKQIGG